ncbi:MAG: aryl-sulfate sulfotransferase [Candidatus Kapaibacterium sp.]
MALRFGCQLHIRLVLAIWGAGTLVVYAQGPVKPLDVEIRGFTTPGYLIAAPLQQDTLLLVDDYGRPLFHTRVGLHMNGQAYGRRYITHFAGLGRKRFFVRRDQYLRAIDTFRIDGAGDVDFHEGKVWTDSSFILLGSRAVQVDLSTTIPGGQQEATVLTGVIQEQTFDGRVIFEWRSLDHVPLTDATDDIDLTQSYIDYIHINSLWRESDGNLLVSCRHTDEILKIERSTGRILWRFGGGASRKGEFTFLNDTTGGFVGFSHQHTVCRTSRGTILMFDNGNLKPEPITTRVVEYQLNEAARTARAIWTYELPTDQFIRSMGSVQELENGHVLVGFGNDPGRTIAQEIDRERGVVASYRTIDEGTNNAYRAHKTTIGMVGLIDTLTTAGVIEFADRDSTTGISIVIDSAVKNVIAAAERHHFLPPTPAFSMRSPEHLFPMRLVLRYRGGDSAWQILHGRTHVDTSVVQFGHRYNDLLWYGRDTVGKGLFSPLNVVYNSGRGRFEFDRILRGEIIAGVEALPAPEPVSPLTDETVAASLCEFRVRLPIGIRECDVVVRKDGESDPVLSRRIVADWNGHAVWYCDSLLPDSKYQWSASAVGSVRVSRPTPPRRFTTSSRAPGAPVTDAGGTTMYVPTGQTKIRWAISDGVRSVIQWVSPIPRDGVGVDFAQANTDTIDQGIAETSVEVTSPGTSLYWRVTALSNDGCLSWSDTVGFCTAPAPEHGMVPISPVIGERNVATSKVKLRYTVSGLYNQYEVLLSRGLTDPSPRGKVADSIGFVVFDSLLPNTRYFWRVVEKTSFADTGALGMFVTGSETSSVESSDSQDVMLSCHARQVHIDSPLPITSLRCVDALGRTVIAERKNGQSEFGRSTFMLPDLPSSMLGLWAIDIRGVTRFCWVLCDE